MKSRLVLTTVKKNGWLHIHLVWPAFPAASELNCGYSVEPPLQLWHSQWAIVRLRAFGASKTKQRITARTKREQNVSAVRNYSGEQSQSSRATD